MKSEDHMLFFIIANKNDQNSAVGFVSYCLDISRLYTVNQIVARLNVDLLYTSK